MTVEWQAIARAQHIRTGTVADLRMDSGEVVPAVFERRGQVTAWWPRAGCRRPIGLYDPRAFRILAAGVGAGL